MPFVQIRVNFDPLFPPQTIDTSWQVACRLRNSFPGKRLRLQINPFGAENQIIASTDL